VPLKLPTALLAAGALALPGLGSFPWRPHLPESVERWLYNPRERTAAAIAAVRRGKPADGMDAADTALRLAPTDPRVRYDAGTAHLLGDDRRGAIRLLEKAAREAPRDLAPAAFYNLGNARLAASDAAGAVAAYKQALRLTPADADAKFNLELALREKEKQRLGAKSPREGSRGDREGQNGSSQHGGANDPGDRQNRSSAHDPGKSDQKKEDAPQSPGEQPQRAGADGRPLPRFRDQPEMSAQEAAALLQSVENLERQQRRRQAAQRSRQHAANGKDW